MHLFNEANIVLLPKKQDAMTLAEYRPISLINNLIKIITKILANRLSPFMNNLVSYAQNAFIRKRCIHDNFLYAQRVIQLLHRNKKLALFIKLDISKAFDSIEWSFLLEVSAWVQHQMERLDLHNLGNIILQNSHSEPKH
jgi:hypothetical protein